MIKPFYFVELDIFAIIVNFEDFSKSFCMLVRHHLFGPMGDQSSPSDLLSIFNIVKLFSLVLISAILYEGDEATDGRNQNPRHLSKDGQCWVGTDAVPAQNYTIQWETLMLSIGHNDLQIRGVVGEFLWTLAIACVIVQNDRNSVLFW